MKRLALAGVVLSLLAGCGADLSDPRTQALLQMPSQPHYAERRVARELAARCSRYDFDEALAEAMTDVRVKAGQPTSIQVRGGLELEANIKRRTLAARYGGDWATLDACAALDGETALGSPLSVLVKRG